MQHTNIKYIALIIIAALIAWAAIYLFPFFAEQDLSGILAIAVFSTIMLLGAAWCFINSLKTFKVGLRVAYYLLATGIVLYSLVLPQFFLSLFVEMDALLRNGLYLVPYGLAAVFAYLGMRKFARLVEAKIIWTSFVFVFILASVMSLLTTLLPHSPDLVSQEITELTIDAVMAVLVWSTVFGIAAAIVATRVQKIISRIYSAAMGWTAVTLLALAFSALHELVVKIYFFDSDYVATDISLWPFVITGMLALRAGLAFKSTPRQTLRLPANPTYVDVVVAAAELVSKPAEIDKELDKLRLVTTSSSNVNELSKDEKTALVRLYLYLENYLATKEPLSKLSKEDLRANLPEQFIVDLRRE